MFKGSKTKKLIAASRLVIPGHLQDTPFQEDGGDRTDAPTVRQLSLHLGLSIVASKRWPGGVFDVSAAFLRGDEMIEDVYFRPPRESLPGVPPGSLTKAKKGIFGLRVAPRNRYVQKGHEDHHTPRLEGTRCTSWRLRVHGRRRSEGHPAPACRRRLPLRRRAGIRGEHGQALRRLRDSPGEEEERHLHLLT